MTETVDTIVIGAGVVGLACARALALAGREVIVLEANSLIGAETSSRNSEVIHAGIYYPTNSLKAKLCVAGKQMLYEFCASHGVPYRRCGKLIVATHPDQHGRLQAIQQQAINNNVKDLRWLEAAEAQVLEPELRCTAALLSPSTGIIDSHAFMLALQGDLEAEGGWLALNSPVLGGAIQADGILLEIGGAEPMNLLAATVINSAGLAAGKVAHSLRGLAAESIPPHYLAKGNYYALTGRSPFSHLIYPVPEQAGLGVHLTFDLANQARFGPDVEWIDTIDYEVDPRRAEVFYAEVRKYWPDLLDDSLLPAYSGIRPKIQAPGQPAADFVIQDEQTHGVAGLINLYGIESPGLTASLAIAQRVCDLAVI